MKYLLFFSLISTVLLAGFGCKKDDAAPTGAMTAKVDGSAWSAKFVGATVLQGLFNLSGKAADGSVLTITLEGSAAGNYGLAANADHAAVWLPAGGGASAFATNAPGGFGLVVITEVNTTDSLVSGTFEFIAENPLTQATVTVMEGKFTNVPFTSSTVPVGNNSFKVKIDGTSWAPVQITGTKLSGSKILINATDAAASRTVGLTMPDNISTGEYDLGDPLFGAKYGGQYNLDSSTFLSSTSGKLKITKHDKTAKRLEGTFHFQASSFFFPATASLTEGSFSVHY